MVRQQGCPEPKEKSVGKKVPEPLSQSASVSLAETLQVCKKDFVAKLYNDPSLEKCRRLVTEPGKG